MTDPGCRVHEWKASLDIEADDPIRVVCEACGLTLEAAREAYTCAMTKHDAILLKLTPNASQAMQPAPVVPGSFGRNRLPEKPAIWTPNEADAAAAEAIRAGIDAPDDALPPETHRPDDDGEEAEPDGKGYTPAPRIPTEREELEMRGDGENASGVLTGLWGGSVGPSRRGRP